VPWALLARAVIYGAVLLLEGKVKRGAKRRGLRGWF
jgi:hypothetical protein